MGCPLQNPTWGWGLPSPFSWNISILIQAKNELSIILVYKTWLCIISWGISAWNMSKMKQRWRKGFCSLLFIVTKVVCKNWKVCGYTEEEETSSVDQTPPSLSLSQSLDVTSTPLDPLILELYIKPRPYNTGKEVGKTQNIEADWCLKEAKRAENSWFIYSLKYSQSMWQSYYLS